MRWLALMLSVGCAAAPVAADRVAPADFKFRLTTRAELEAVLGPPLSSLTKQDGGMELLHLEWPTVAAKLARSGTATTFTLLYLIVDGQAVDIGEDRPLQLRSNRDLALLNPFDGFSSVSLVKIDLRAEEQALRAAAFDTRTVWPPAHRLPPGFDPAAILEQAKNPGLGVRALHAQGIDGRGVTIAIIDQPIQPDHRSYAARIDYEVAPELSKLEPQMHGPPVVSIAVGSDVGVAPAGRVRFIALAMWKPDNAPVAEALERIVAQNAGLPDAQRVRVVSVSTGNFGSRPHLERWRQAERLAEAAGIFVITCEGDTFAHGSLMRTPDADPDDPGSYRPQFASKEDLVRAPASGRTTASHLGPDVYAFWAEGGMSWATPWIAGLAALAHQVRPGIAPAAIRALMARTATPTAQGPIANPRAFIDAVRSGADR